MSTHHLQREAQAAAVLKTALEGVIDPDDDRALHDLIEGETGLLEAIDATMAQMAEDAALAEATQKQSAQLTARKAWCERRIERMKDALKTVLEQFPELRGVRRPFGTIYLGSGPTKVDIYDEAAIPNYYKHTPLPPPRVPDKAKILDAIKAGDTVPGARLVEGSTYLAVRK